MNSRQNFSFSHFFYFAISAIMLASTPAWGNARLAICRQIFEIQTNASSENTPKVKHSFRLFKAGQFRRKYTKIVENLKRGHEIILPSGVRFIVHSVLGQGAMTKVVHIGNGFALRLPLNGTSKHADFDPKIAVESIQSFYKLQKELSANGIRVVEMNEHLSEPPFGIVVKKEQFQFTADEFFANNSVIRKKLSAAEILMIEEKFIKFMTSTWAYTNIGDTSPRQFGYNGQEWVLFDFYEYGGFGHLPLRNFQQKEIIMSTRSIEGDFGETSVRQLPSNIEALAKKKINLLRSRLAHNGDWFERLSDTSLTRSELIDRVTPDPLPSDFQVIFDTQDTRFARDFEGRIPAEPKIMLTQFKKVGEQSNFSIYEALVNGQMLVEIYVLKKQAENFWEQIDSLAEKAIANHISVLRGEDFVMFYKNSDTRKLKNVSEL